MHYHKGQVSSFIHSYSDLQGKGAQLHNNPQQIKPTKNQQSFNNSSPRNDEKNEKKDIKREGQESQSLTFRDATEIMRNFVREREWEKYHTPRNLVMAMMGEVGEIAEIFQWKGEVENGLKGFSQSEKTHVGEQIADVMSYLIRLADVSGINLEEAWLRKIEKNRQKYPKDVVKGNTDLIQKYKKKKWAQNEKQKPNEKPSGC